MAAPGAGHHAAPTTARWLAVGHAAGRGLQAALSAGAGFTSDLKLADGDFLKNIFGITFNVALLGGGLGGLALSQTSFKPWCAARQTMAATQALIEIVSSGIAVDAIAQVTAFVLPLHRRMIDHGVTVGDRASFLTSLPYRLALAALVPQAAWDVGQAPADVADPIRAFMDRVVVAPDEALLSNFPSRWPARIEVMTSASRHKRTVMDVPGDPTRPFDADAVREKFQRLAGPVIGAEACGNMLERAFGLLGGKTDSAALLRQIEETHNV
jgi:2-methylcitrate dehydratase PrpD